jgi:hypothetical protein
VSLSGSFVVGAAAALAFLHQKRPGTLSNLNPFKSTSDQVIEDNPLYENSAFSEYVNPTFEPNVSI